MVCSSCGNNEAMYCARCFHSSSGRTAENTVGTQPTDAQQLKAEIALLPCEIERAYNERDSKLMAYLCNKLRQLSAV
jgi:hypothetical protein